MTSLFLHATDARQSPQWCAYLEQIGWHSSKIEHVYVFYRKLPFVNRTVIKIQHPTGPLPFKKIDAFAKAQRALFCIIEPHLKGFDRASWTENGYIPSSLQFAHTATYLIDLTKSESALIASFSENTRRNIRKSEKSCRVEIIELKHSADERVFQKFYSLYRHIGMMKQFYVPSFSEVRSKLRAFKDSSALFFAYERSTERSVRDSSFGEPIAVLWVGSVNRTLVYFHPGNTEKGYDLLANYLLVWKAIQWGKKKKLNVFDFETAYDSRYPRENKKWQGYTEFKKKFGGELLEYPPTFIKFYSGPAKMLYQFFTMSVK